MKYTYILSLSLVTAASMTGSSFAATINGQNTTTGESSRNIIDVVIDSTIIDQETTTVISNNTFTFDLATGNNQANSNTGDGTAKSGSIDATLVDTNQPAPQTLTSITHNLAGVSSISADLSGQASIIISDDPVTVVTENANTGANSTNITDVTKTSTVTVSKTTTYNEVNDFDLNLSTGNNAADFNTGNGLVESGNINVFVKKETLPPPSPEKPKPAPAPSAPPAAQPAPPSTPALQPTIVPTPIQEIKPIIAEKLAQLVPSQPTQIVTPAAQPAQQAAAPTAPAPAAKLPRAGAEVPLAAALLSAASLKGGQYLKKRHRALLYRTKKPW